MRLFGWLRRAPQEPEAAQAEARRRWTWLSGRRILSAGTYILPKDKIEGDRLDLQHHLLKVAVGKNYRAPIRQPRAILDVACGTGLWGREMAQEFKHAQVVGFDIDRTPMEAALARLGPTGQFPPNFRFLEADALKPFPFEDEQFDFTHARFISPFIPIARWPHVVGEMVRVTKRGGYVELVDFDTPPSSNQTLNDFRDMIFKPLCAMSGLHAGAAPYLADYLRGAGLTHVQERHVVLGAGAPGNRQQRLLVADATSFSTNLRPAVVKLGIMSEAAYDALLAKFHEELPRAGYTWPVTFAFSIRL
jgi:ubiquinone/menaquinone biosynthesis C-methylase UbiE